MARLGQSQSPLVPKVVRMDESEWVALGDIDAQSAAHHAREAIREYLAKQREPQPQ